jgi:ABC-type antimicrobial peptide transport system permease subunit
MEQTKEIAVLRSIGVTKFRMSAIYVFESFTLVFSSCVIGMIVGFLIGFTMSNIFFSIKNNFIINKYKSFK